jgi:hypothetical protein
MTDGCRVLLLRLLEDMTANGIVSIERIKLAKSLGLLVDVRRARPKVTAVYQATLPGAIALTRRGTPSVPLEDFSEVRPPVSVTGTESVPLKGGSEVRMYPTQEVVGAAPHSPAAARIDDLTQERTEARRGSA